MKLGFLSAILPEYTFKQVIDFAADNGFSCVELACWPVGKAERRYAGVSHIDMNSLTEESASFIKDYTKKRNVTISALGYYPNVLTADDTQRTSAREHLKKCVVGAELLGVPVVNTFIGKNRELPLKENLEEFTAFWPGMIRFAEEHHVKIGIENCRMYFWDEWPAGDNLACTPEFWRYMFQEIDSGFFGLDYDPSHLVCQKMDYLKPVYGFGNKMFHFHIKDAKFYQEKFDEAGMFAPPLTYFSPKLPGQGDIDWGAMISALNDIGYKGAGVLEIEDRAYENTLEERLSSILLARDYMRQFVRE